uniref:Ankyrin repeat domain 12 n=1 Tax=Molossus molossus TaxID=27622 RepID=A0A7J8HEJ5_MOLMO|nr:ankyrin repeat domain 12 [Molossus molossus]
MKNEIQTQIQIQDIQVKIGGRDLYLLTGHTQRKKVQKRRKQKRKLEIRSPHQLAFFLVTHSQSESRWHFLCR